ncbi:10210_t:CDS:2, partial [Funneliformis geosporum]
MDQPVLEYLGLEPLVCFIRSYGRQIRHVRTTRSSYSEQLNQMRIEELERSNKVLSEKENYLQENINKRSGLNSGSPTDVSNSKFQQLETQLEYLHDHVIGLEQDIAKLEQDKASLAEHAEEERQEILEELQNTHEKNGIFFIKLQKLEDFINELRNDTMHHEESSDTMKTFNRTLNNIEIPPHPRK